MLQTDYLVIGAGAASMAFVDTLLAEQPNASIIIVDKHDAPGGHWNDAYGFVQLHQPSLLYGVSSSQMEGNWAKLVLKGTLPWQHRASKEEILTYYQKLMNKWAAAGRVHYFKKCIYNFDDSNGDHHSFQSLDGSQTYNVKVTVKLVNGILGECAVPSKTPPTFPVDKSIKFLTPNQVYETFNKTSPWRLFFSSSNNSQKYAVLGAGKTAMDTVVYLQRHGVPADNITWVVPNDVWLIRREGPGTPWSWGESLLENDLDVDAAALALEKRGVFARLDTNIMPTKFRFPVVGNDEMKILQKVKSVIRCGRVTSIEEGGRVSFTTGESLAFDDHVFVHCTSPGPFNGNILTSPFPNDKEICLCFLYAPPVPISMSSIAVLESRRRNGTLDIEFGRKLLKALGNDKGDLTENDVLEMLITGYNISAKGTDQVTPLKVLAQFMAIFDEDPVTAYAWLSSNRLSFFCIPGFKGKVYENVLCIIEKQQTLGLSAQETEMLSLVADKLKPLEGK